ncbi:MAG: VTC domain-containing protein [Candidatus Dadabacteria bacterium]|nr:MAG: VTC domain-containing protein [Candidatus Dadabacteria bacterium]
MISLPIEEARYEIKFVSDFTRYDAALYWLLSHPLRFQEIYWERRVNNIYFDSYDLACYRENIAGISERKKYRLRWYGETLCPKGANLEIKIRKNQLGWKLSHQIGDLPLLSQISHKRCISHIEKSLPLEIGEDFARYSQVTLLSHYHRRYFLSLCGRVRATVDRDLIVYDQRLGESFNLEAPTPTPTILVLELKASYKDRDILSRATDTISFRYSRNSKYALSIANLI